MPDDSVANDTQKSLLELEFFLRVCNVERDRWVADLTCGSGSGCIAGLRLGFHVAGFDISEHQVEATSARIQMFHKFEVRIFGTHASGRQHC